MDLSERAFDAVRDGDLRKLKRCFRKGFDPLTFDACGWTVLGAAAKWGHVHIVKYLLKTVHTHGYVDLSYLDTYGRHVGPTESPLHLACACTNDKNHKTQLEIIELLIRYGADVHHRDGIGYTPYVRASISATRRDDILKILEGHGCSEEDMVDGSTIATIRRIYGTPTDHDELKVCIFLLKRRYKATPIPRSFANSCVAWYVDYCYYHHGDTDAIQCMRTFVYFLYTHNRR